MADGWLYDQEGSGTLRVPFVFIPEGAAQPTEWLAEHPNHIRMPAKFVPAKQPPRIGAPAPRSGGRIAGSPPDDAGTRAAVPVRSYAPIGPRRGRKFAAPPQIDRSGYLQESPVATYLRISETFDRMGIGLSAPSPPLPANMNGQGISPRPARDVPPQSDAVAGGASETGSTADPTAPVKLVDGRGNTVNSYQTEQAMLRPAGFGPEFFIQKGLEDRQIVEQLKQSSGGEDWGAIAAIVYEMDKLSNFRQSHSWDAQRLGGKYHEKYREYATVAIGLYGAAAGISESEILSLQDDYARFFSHFAPNTKFDKVYVHLPANNVQNTHLGYDLYQSYTEARPVR